MILGGHKITRNRQKQHSLTAHSGVIIFGDRPESTARLIVGQPSQAPMIRA